MLNFKKGERRSKGSPTATLQISKAGSRLKPKELIGRQSGSQPLVSRCPWSLAFWVMLADVPPKTRYVEKNVYI